MFKYKEKNGIYLQYSGCSRLQKIHQHSTLYSSKQQSTQTGCCTIAACFPFEPLEKCTTFKAIFPGLSRSWNFQEKKSRTFQEAWEPWYYNCPAVL